MSDKNKVPAGCWKSVQTSEMSGRAAELKEQYGAPMFRAMQSVIAHEREVADLMRQCYDGRGDCDRCDFSEPVQFGHDCRDRAIKRGYESIEYLASQVERMARYRVVVFALRRQLIELLNRADNDRRMILALQNLLATLSEKEKWANE